MWKTKVVLQWVKVNTTLYCPVSSVSSEIPSVVTPGGDRVANMDTEHGEKMVQMQLKEPKGICKGGL